MIDWVATGLSGFGVAMVGGAARAGLILWDRRGARPGPKRDVNRLLVGNWAGCVEETDASDDEALKYEVTWNFRLGGKGIICESPATYKQDGKTFRDEYRLDGHVVHDRFVVIEYRNLDTAQINFGTEIIQLSDTGNAFSGRFVGYSSERGKIISGRIQAKRMPDSR